VTWHCIKSGLSWQVTGGGVQSLYSTPNYCRVGGSRMVCTGLTKYTVQGHISKHNTPLNVGKLDGIFQVSPAHAAVCQLKFCRFPQKCSYWAVKGTVQWKLKGVGLYTIWFFICYLVIASLQILLIFNPHCYICPKWCCVS
jgi:hypothetical protein